MHMGLILVIALFGTGVLASSAAIVAVAIDKFRKIVAGSFALAGGMVPPLSFALWHDWIPESNILWAISIFGSGPLLLIAFFLYEFSKCMPSRGVAASASLVGTMAGMGFSAFLYSLLSRME